jgi:hypothetical protein
METLNEPVVTPLPVPTGDDPLSVAIRRFLNRTPEEIQAARERILANSQPPRPLPEGKTLEDVVCGTWPGDETDEEILDMLERLS